MCSKLEFDVEIKADAKAFHEVCSCRPHHVSNASPTNIQACHLLQGEWGKPGTVINWNYVHEGKEKTAKEIIEAIDDEKNMTRFKVIGGDLMEEYKRFVIEVQATPTPKPVGGSVVHWILEYELKHDQVPHPHTLSDFLVEVTNDIDAHLVVNVNTPAAAAAAAAAQSTSTKLAT